MALAADTSAARNLDEDRRKINAALVCLNDGVIDTDDDDNEITNFEDMFDDHRWAGADKNSSNASIALWGLDLDTDGAVMCRSALGAALKAMGQDGDDLGIVKALTDGKYSNFAKPIPEKDLADGWPKFKSKVQKAKDDLHQKIVSEHGSEVYDFLLRERITKPGGKGILSACYTSVDKNKADKALDQSADGIDFDVKLEDGSTRRFYYRGNDALRKTMTTNNGGWYNDDGAGGRPPRIGDIEMDTNLSGSATHEQIDPKNDGFFPFGADRSITNHGSGYNRTEPFGVNVTNGILPCRWLKDNKDFLFKSDFKQSGETLGLVDPVTGKSTDVKPAVDPDDPGEDEENCENKSGALGWIMCPVIRMLDGAIEELDERIANLLYVPVNHLDDDKMRAASVRVRNLAYIILVPIMLVMVIGTALGFEFVSAYTLKRSLPRLVIAVIFIALAYDVSRLLIELTNAAGAGIDNLLLQPLIGSGSGSLSSAINTAQGAGVTVAAGVGVFAAIAILGPSLLGIVMLYALSVAMIFFITFIILAVRQVLILILALLGPLAILAWIFPGNDKMWKLWWGSFTKLLLLFPLITLLITSGKVFAQFVSTAQGGIFGAFLAITAYVAPYFLIKSAFTWAGGAFAAIGGMVNDRSKGLFDRSRAARGELMQQRHADNMDAKTGFSKTRFGGAYRRAASLGRNGSWTPNAWW